MQFTLNKKKLCKNINGYLVHILALCEAYRGNFKATFKNENHSIQE